MGVVQSAKKRPEKRCVFMASVTLDRNAAYLQLLGYTGFGAGEPNDVSAGLAQYRAQNGIPAATRTENVIRQMREEVAADPDVITRMQKLAAGGTNAYHEGVVQLGLRALGQPGAVDGELKESDRAQLRALEGKAPVQPQATFNQAAQSDPQTALSQAYLRVLGYTGGEKNDVGRIDGIFGPKTTAAMAQFANANKISPDDPQGLEKTEAALKAQALTPDNLKRMEEALNAADPTKPNQDVRAIQTILKEAGLNVAVDGRAGPQTMAALHAQQVKTGAAPQAPQAPQQDQLDRERRALLDSLSPAQKELFKTADNGHNPSVRDQFFANIPPGTEVGIYFTKEEKLPTPKPAEQRQEEWGRFQHTLNDDQKKLFEAFKGAEMSTKRDVPDGVREVELKQADGPQERIEIAPGQAVPAGIPAAHESAVVGLTVEQTAPPVAVAPAAPAETPAEGPAETPPEKPWFAGQHVTDRGKTYTEGGQYEAVRSDRGTYTAPFNNAAASGYPYAAPSPAAAALKGLGLETALGNKGGFLGTGINFQVNSRGQYGVQVPGANIYKR